MFAMSPVLLSAYSLSQAMLNRSHFFSRLALRRNHKPALGLAADSLVNH
jgi:hypothetical protein